MILFVQNDLKVPAGIYGEQLFALHIAHSFWRPYGGEKIPDPTCLAGVIILGGYMGVHDTEQYSFLRQVKSFIGDMVARQTPLLGICLGAQLLADVLGAPVATACRGERGVQSITLTGSGRSDPLFAGIPEKFAAFEWHNDSFDIPPGALHLAASAQCRGQAFRFGSCAYGVQFHPEVDAPLVAAWSRRIDPDGNYERQYLASANAVQETSFRLLDNFLSFCISS
jgi:GMP synthase (glutamine-hydrolysing)